MTTPCHGLLVIDKPAGITSRDAVDRAQRWFPRGTRIGHTGTLDPLATGVLVLCIGNATRLTEYVQRMPKTYRAGVILGARSDTDDADGTITPAPDVTSPALDVVKAALDAFVGEITQVPPAFSATKIAGRRAYDLARRGKDVTLSPRVVTVHGIDLLHYAFPRLDIEVRCSKGTYIRSLARDLGEKLGCGGYIESLRRTRVGCFDVATALPADADAETARLALLPIEAAVSELPRRLLSATEAARIRQGQALPLMRADEPSAEIAMFDEQGKLVAVGVVDRKHGCVRPNRVMAD